MSSLGNGPRSTRRAPNLGWNPGQCCLVINISPARLRALATISNQIDNVVEMDTIKRRIRSTVVEMETIIKRL